MSLTSLLFRIARRVQPTNLPKETDDKKRCTTVNNSPSFSEACFSDFIQQTSEKLGEVFTVVQRMATDGKINDSFTEMFKCHDLNLSTPLLSKIPLSNIFDKLEDIKKECNVYDTDFVELCDLVKQFIHFVSNHELHILLGGLRNADQPNLFIFNICEQNFEEWMDFASDSTLFGSVLKATWLRCEVADDKHFVSVQVLQTLLKEASPSCGIQDFTNHFQRVHFAPVCVICEILNSITR